MRKLEEWIGKKNLSSYKKLQTLQNIENQMKKQNVHYVERQSMVQKEL